MVFDPHAEPLIRPTISASDAARVARESYALDAGVKELGSNQDRNFLLTPASGPRYLLKFDNDGFSSAELAAQNAAVRAAADRGIAVPTPIRNTDGEWITTATVDGKRTRARLLSFVEGESLVNDGHLFPSIIARMGALAGEVAAALASLEDPALDRDLQWDMRNSMAVIEAYVPALAPERRAHVLAASRAAWDTVRAQSLPLQAIHGDITDDNVVGPRDAFGRVVPTAVIDWGDVGRGWRVAELAVTLSSLLHHQKSALDVLPAIEAFNAITPLTEPEITALWPLVVLRGAVVAVSGEHLLSLDPGNAYVAERIAHERRIFENAAALPPAFAEAAIRAAIGQSPPNPEKPTHALLALPQATLVRLDAASPHLHRGAFRDPDIEARLADDVLSRGHAPVFSYAEARLTRSAPPGAKAPDTGALVTELQVPQAMDVVAPFDGQVASTPEGILLKGTFGEIEVRGARASAEDSVTAGSRIGTLPARTRCIIQWRLTPTPVPDFAPAPSLPGWLRLTADPAQLLHIPSAQWLPDAKAARARRLAAVPGAAEQYYESAPEIERGWRTTLLDTSGRAYLDMVNNVSAIGHAHPGLADAVHAQLLTLNTNNRFLYSSLAEYTERLAALVPRLDAVLLVNSGSEAVDLALRLARVHTSRKAVVCQQEAYHGWTAASDAVSTSDWDNPGSGATRPAHVYVAPAPNAFRGKHRGEGAGAAYISDFEALLARMDAEGCPVGAFITEPVFGNGGGVLPPRGYLEAAYAAVRARGGVCIADEVQVGLGRLGHHMWGHEAAGGAPDIVVCAKALGNAYPLGCVITTKEIAASLADEGMFFSSAGGATASCVAGLAVLNALRDEDLPGNAARVGDHLAGRFARLREKYPLIGALHGMGLYQGVEFVFPGEERRAATAATEWVCERMADFGVIVQPTSERRNVLKIKPPLTLSIPEADWFADALDVVLGELEARRVPRPE